MGRYRGKREASRQGEEQMKPVQERREPSRTEDPFAEQVPREEKLSFWERAQAFLLTKKGRTCLIVTGCLAALVLAGSAAAIALGSWIKPPELPAGPIEGTNPVQQGQTKPEDREPAGPTDDELYPDDGYTGDMPTVSGKRKEGVYTFLLVGTDKDDGNTDTLMVVSYDTVNQDINIMSIPRDTMVNASWDIKKINSIYSRYKDGMDALLDRIKTLVGFRPDFYAKVELSMFVELVELIGGVEFDVPQDMNYDDPYQDLHIHLKKGVQTLNGEQAMGLVRFRRYAEGDIKRVEVQQNFIKALIKECVSLQHWGKIKAYIDLAMEHVETDLDTGSIVWFAANVLGLNSAPALNTGDIYTCTLPANYYASAWSRDTDQNQSYVTIYPQQVVELVNERFNPYEQRVTAGMLDAMSILSNGDIASSTGSLRDSRHNAIMAVRRGEAYYDDNGNLVYGTPPAKVQQDEEGNFFILDEDGSKIFTNEDGTPLDSEPTPPPEGEDPGAAGPGSKPDSPFQGLNPEDGDPIAQGGENSEPADASSGESSAPPENPTDIQNPAENPPDPDGEPTLPPPEDIQDLLGGGDSAPQEPPPAEEPTVDSEPPGWL